MSKFWKIIAASSSASSSTTAKKPSQVMGWNGDGDFYGIKFLKKIPGKWAQLTTKFARTVGEVIFYVVDRH